MTVCQIVYDDLNASRGVGADAIALRDSLGNVLRDLCRSESLGSARWQTLAAIDEVGRECSIENWDGYGAQPVKADVLREARRFARALPPDFPLPNVGADPDGEISFDWDFGPRRVFSVSISGAGRLSYAGLFDQDRIHGTESFRAAVPPFIIMSVRRLLFTLH